MTQVNGFNAIRLLFNHQSVLDNGVIESDDLCYAPELVGMKYLAGPHTDSALVYQCRVHHQLHHSIRPTHMHWSTHTVCAATFLDALLILCHATSRHTVCSTGTSTCSRRWRAAPPAAASS